LLHSYPVFSRDTTLPGQEIQSTVWILLGASPKSLYMSKKRMENLVGYFSSVFSFQITYVRMVLAPLLSFFNKASTGNARVHDYQMLFRKKKRRLVRFVQK
jgi:hypothetical protein